MPSKPVLDKGQLCQIKLTKANYGLQTSARQGLLRQAKPIYTMTNHALQTYSNLGLTMQNKPISDKISCAKQTIPDKG